MWKFRTFAHSCSTIYKLTGLKVGKTVSPSTWEWKGRTDGLGEREKCAFCQWARVGIHQLGQWPFKGRRSASSWWTKKYAENLILKAFYTETLQETSLGSTKSLRQGKGKGSLPILGYSLGVTRALCKDLGCCWSLSSKAFVEGVSAEPGRWELAPKLWHTGGFTAQVRYFLPALRWTCGNRGWSWGWGMPDDGSKNKLVLLG